MEYDFSEVMPEEAKEVLKNTFKELKERVFIEVFTDGENGLYDAFTTEFVRALSGGTNKIEGKFYKLNSEKARERGVTRSPTTLIDPDKYNIRFVGAPSGEEGRTLIMAIVLCSTRRTIFSDSVIKRLVELEEPRHVQVIVSPSCPYCPQQALNAVSAAIVRPFLVRAEIVEMYENAHITDKYHIITVPFTVMNDVPIGTGLKPPELFVDELFSLSSGEKMVAPVEGETLEADILIIGGGPAGLTAGIYAGRSGLNTVILEEATVGGQVLITPVVENYPAFTRIAGKTMVDMMYQQALQYTTIFESEGAIDVRRIDELFEVRTNRRVYHARGIIIATGAENRKLDVTGERRFFGRGVSYCATCDGYFFKDGKTVILVGGGNTAVTDALYLESIGANVTMVHRRDKLRAETFLQKSLMEKKIPIYWNTVIKEIEGDNTVKEVIVQNLKDKTIQKMPVAGVFVAIGYIPNNEVAKMLSLKLGKEGYIKVDSRQMTSLERVYAAGDVTGGVKQIATAVGQGTVAALSAFEDLSKPYWKKDKDEYIKA